MRTIKWFPHAEPHAEPHLNLFEPHHATAVETGNLVFLQKRLAVTHFTLHDYLHSQSTLNHSRSQSSTRTLSRSPTRPPSNLQHAQFLESSSLDWRIHAKRDLSNCVKLLALKLFNSYKLQIHPNPLKSTEAECLLYTFGKPSLFNSLHRASIFVTTRFQRVW